MIKTDEGKVLGIVGSEAAKFTESTEFEARLIIRTLLLSRPITDPIGAVVSGACHLGGIDVWAIEEAKKLGFQTHEFPPKDRAWSTGYKPRNIEIAKASDIVVCLTVATLPEGYTGMRFKMCYHCGVDTHVKSGGCWTVKYAKKLGKEGYVVVI